MGITCYREGDYLIPDLKRSDTTEYQIGTYGKMRQRFLKENHEGIYTNLRFTQIQQVAFMVHNQIIHPLIDGLFMNAYPFVYFIRFIEPFFRIVIVFLIFFICIIVYATRINRCHFFFMICSQIRQHPFKFSCLE
ncbi:MAG: TnpV protein [Lachnospiraceae bacterium]|nr:TnpV protein [Lachnospiraceae bacterium]